MVCNESLIFVNIDVIGVVLPKVQYKVSHIYNSKKLQINIID